MDTAETNILTKDMKNILNYHMPNIMENMEDALFLIQFKNNIPFNILINATNFIVMIILIYLLKLEGNIIIVSLMDIVLLNLKEKIKSNLKYIV